MRRVFLILLGVICFIGWAKGQSAASEKEAYLSWTAAQAESVGKSMRVKGRVGGFWDSRGLSTNRAINYELRATLMTPEVIRASARLEQLRNRLTDEQTQNLVKEAEQAGDLVIMVEIDPNEGSGVIPLDWRVFLQPAGLKPDAEGAIAGIKSPHLRNVKALSGVFRRDYDYDVFWVVFPLVNDDGKPSIADNVSQIELLVGIYNKEGRATWQIPESVRAKIKARVKEESEN